MKNLFYLFVLVLCFACSNSDTVLDDLASQSGKEKVNTRSMGLSVSQDSWGLTVSWSSPFGCGGPLSRLNVTNLTSGEAATYYGDASSGSHTFPQFKYSGTYLVMASCNCGNHSVSETYFFSPDGQVVVNPETKCNHDYSKIATYMPNELYLLGGSVYLRLWLSGSFIVGLRPTTYNEFTETGPGSEVYYEVSPIEWSSYSEYNFYLPYNSNEFHRYWELRIYSKECFTNGSHNPCSHYLSFKFGYDPIVGDQGPSFNRPLQINFTEVKKK